MKPKFAENLFYGISILAVLVGGISWLNSMDSKAQANTDQINKMQNQLDLTVKQFEEIRTRLTHIEDMVKADQ